jgi:acetolactate synthase-1/2/3 large subunit
MIKQFQYLYFNSRYYDTDKDSGYNAPDFLKIAQAYGIKSVRITEKTPAWRRKIREILMKEKDQPLLVDIDFNYQTFIYPKLEYDKPIHKIDPQLRGKEKDLAER